MSDSTAAATTTTTTTIATSECSCANCQCGDKCQCVEQCKGQDDCCPCICTGCDGSSSQCDKDTKCFCTKGCCVTVECSRCANCVYGASWACGDQCKGNDVTGCCASVCQGCDGSASKCEKDKCSCDKTCCASEAKCSFSANFVCGPSCACGDQCKGNVAGCCLCVCQGCDGSACKDNCFCDKTCSPAKS